MKEAEEILKPLSPTSRKIENCTVYFFRQDDKLVSIKICDNRLYGEIFGNRRTLKALASMDMSILWMKPNYFAYTKTYETKEDLLKDLKALVALYK